MSKLNVLYNVMKTMKETEVIEGKANVEAIFDDLTIGTFEAEFKKDKLNGNCEKKVKAQIGTEEFKFEHEGKMKVSGNMCKEGHGHHHHFEKCCNGAKNKMDKMMMLIKVLDKMELQELENGRKVLGLTFEGDDIPKEVIHMLHKKMEKHHEGHGHCCGHHEKFKAMFENCPCKDINKETIRPEKVEIQVFISKEFKVESKSAHIKLNAKDFDNKEHSLSLEMNCEIG